MQRLGCEARRSTSTCTRRSSRGCRRGHVLTPDRLRSAVGCPDAFYSPATGEVDPGTDLQRDGESSPRSKQGVPVILHSLHRPRHAGARSAGVRALKAVAGLTLLAATSTGVWGAFLFSFALVGPSNLEGRGAQAAFVALCALVGSVGALLGAGGFLLLRNPLGVTAPSVARSAIGGAVALASMAAGLLTSLRVVDPPLCWIPALCAVPGCAYVAWAQVRGAPWSNLRVAAVVTRTLALPLTVAAILFHQNVKECGPHVVFMMLVAASAVLLELDVRRLLRPRD